MIQHLSKKYFAHCLVIYCLIIYERMFYALKTVRVNEYLEDNKKVKMNLIGKLSENEKRDHEAINGKQYDIYPFITVREILACKHDLSSVQFFRPQCDHCENCEDTQNSSSKILL